jgi:hypothetical protein
MSDVPRMPALPVTNTTPTAQLSPARMNRSCPCNSSQINLEGVARVSSNSIAPSTRRRSVSREAFSSSASEGHQRETVVMGGEGGCGGSGGGDAVVVDGISLPRTHNHRSSGGCSTSRLPAMLLPSKLTSVPSSSSCVLTSPARMASQPDVNALFITSPARRCCLTAGTDSTVDDTRHHSSIHDSNSNSVVSDRGERKPPTAAVGNQGANRSSGGATITPEARDVHTELLPIPSPPPPPSSMASLTSASRRTTGDPNHNSGSASLHRTRTTASPETETETVTAAGDAYLRENPRVRTLVDHLYQHVLTVQPDDPLHYLAHLNVEALPQPSRTAQPENDNKGIPHCPSTSVGAEMEEVPVPSPAATTVPPATTCSRGGNGDNGVTAPLPAVPLASDAVPPPPSQQQSALQQQLRPPLSRPGRLVTPRAVHLHSSLDSGSSAGLASNPLAQTSTITIAGSTADANTINNNSRRRSNSSNSGSTHHTSVFAMTAPTHTISADATEEGAISSGGGGNNNNNGRAGRAPPPSAPTTSLATRLSSAGSPTATAHLRSSGNGGGGGGKPGSPFYLQRSSFHTAGGGSVPLHSVSSGVGLAGHSSRPAVHQSSFAGSLPGQEKGDATPSDVSSLFSTNSVDLQEFITEFRLAKEECFGGGIECPMITFDEFATVMESVAFPFSDAAALLDLFDELQPCARYLAAMVPATTTTITEGGSGGAAAVTPSLSTRTLGSGLSRWPRDGVHGSGTSATTSPPAWGNTITGVMTDSACKLRISTSSGMAAAAANATAATAATQHPVNNGDDCADRAVARHWGTDYVLPVATSLDHRRAEGTESTDTPTTTTAAPTSVAGAYLASSTFIPTPPPAKMGLTEGDDEAGAGAEAAAAAAATTAAPAVPFDTLMARMAYKIQGRYSAEAIRIAFFGMMVDDDAAGAADTSATAAAAARGMCNVLSSDSLAPSEPAGTSSSTTTTLNYANISSSCTVPLPRCISEGLYARLGMVDITSNDVQRGVRSAGLPTTSEEQLTCECRLEDFARLVRAVTTVTDRGFSVSPGTLCLSSLRDSSLQRGASATASSWKEEGASTSSKVSGGFPLHSIRYM